MPRRPPIRVGFVTLREYLERLIALQFASAKLATSKAEIALKVRLDAMAVNLDAMSRDIKELSNWRSNIEGRMWAIGAGAVLLSIAISAAGLFLKK